MPDYPTYIPGNSQPDRKPEPAVPNEPSDEPLIPRPIRPSHRTTEGPRDLMAEYSRATPSAIGDELKHKLQQRADQWEANPVTKGYLREVWPLIEAYVEQQTKLARIDELKHVGDQGSDTTWHDSWYSIDTRINILEASIKERSEDRAQ